MEESVLLLRTQTSHAPLTPRDQSHQAPRGRHVRGRGRGRGEEGGRGGVKGEMRRTLLDQEVDFVG